MSICQQAIAARHRACSDKRYKSQKFGDAAVSRRRLDAKIRREKERQMRTKKR